MNMLEVIIWSALFIVSFLVLTKSSQYLVNSIKELSHAFNIPSFIIGVTVVAIGTSIPELTSSIFSVIKDSSEIAIGNIVGSNIANVFFVLGISSLFSVGTLRIKEKQLNLSCFMLICASILLVITIIDGVFTIYESLIFIIFFVIYLFATKEFNYVFEDLNKKVALKYKTLIIFFISLIFILISSKYVVESVINLSRLFGVGKEIMASTILSLGTTLPDLMVGVVAIRRNEPGIAIGNVVGANVFHILGIIGIARFFGKIIIPKTIISFALPVMLLSTFIFFIIFNDGELNKPEGLILILIYLFFFIHSFGII